MSPEEALAKCIELGERRRQALDDLQQVRYELPRVALFAVHSRGVSKQTVAEAVGVDPATIDRWFVSGDSSGWLTWSWRGEEDEMPKLT